MMVRTLGAQIGLLTFAVAIVAGIYAGNSASVILTRALGALLVGAVIGQASGWAARLVLREHLQRKKLHIDRQHLEALQALSGETKAETAPSESQPAEAG
jgi:NhaP-type Na+/H+ or K+/H+ antiporter